MVSISMFLVLELFKEDSNKFSLSRSQSLKEVCNAPKDKSGVYLIYTVLNSEKTLVYIGSSGKMMQNGKLKTRKDGLWARLVKGNHNSTKNSREKVWPNLISPPKIDSIYVEWFVTFNESLKQIPLLVESKLIQEYWEKEDCLPIWNQQF